MKHSVYIFIALSLLLSSCATSVMTSGRVVIQDDESTLAIAFSSRDRRLIRDYYKKTKKKTPPGLAKRGHLPPGLAKRDTLPSGLRGRNLPDELERRLSQLPDGYVRVIVGSDIVLMKSRTRVIIDIYRNIYAD